MSIFNHLTLVEEIITEIDMHDLSAEERDELVELAQKTLHHHVLSTVLDHLPKDKHHHFITEYHRDPANQQLLTWLKQEITEDIEAKIKLEAARVKKEILTEIKKAKVNRK